jgi:hypothetical protein
VRLGKVLQGLGKSLGGLSKPKEATYCVGKGLEHLDLEGIGKPKVRLGKRLETLQWRVSASPKCVSARG